MYIGQDLQVAFQSYKVIDDISSSFNGSTTSFALLVNGSAPVPLPINSQQCLISVAGVIQRPDDSGAEGFRLSGGNIVFSSAPATGADFFGVILAGADYVNAGGTFPDGSVAVPSITFNDDTDTGLFRSGSGSIGFTFNAVNSVTLSSTGLQSVLGSAANPSLSFIGDLNTGIYSPSAGSVAISTNGSQRATVDNSGRLLVGTSTARTNLYNTGTITSRHIVEVAADLVIEYLGIRNTNDANGANLGLGKSRGTSAGSNTLVLSGDTLGQIDFFGSDGSEFVQGALIKAEVDGTPGANDMPGRLVFSTTADGASNPTERMRITNTGTFRIGQTTTDTPGLGATTTGIGFEPGNGSIFLSRADGASLYLNANVNDAVARFSRSGTQVGNISVTTTATTFNSTSDYRLKENVVALAGAVDRVKQLKPSRFNFISEPSKTVDGFIAHEAQAVVPECVTGEKDAVDADGNPVYQGIDQSKLVPLLTAALQEAITEIASLKDRVAALEAS